MVILLSESTFFIWHSLMCLLVLLKDLSLGFTYLFITVLCSSVKHSEYCLFGDTIIIACPLNSATDGSLPQSDIGSVCGWCAANSMKFNTDETKVRSSMLTTYCLTQSKCCDSHVLWPTLILLLIVPYCYITPYLVLSKNMPHLSGVILWLLMPITNWLEHLQQKSAALWFSCFFSSYLQLYLCILASKVAYFMI